MAEVAFCLGRAPHFKAGDRLAFDVHPTWKLPVGCVLVPRIDVLEQSATGALGDTYVESERSERIITMLGCGYLEFEVQPPLGTFEVAAQQLRCRVTEKWLRDCFANNDQMTVADCVEAARVFIDEGVETFKKLYGRDTVQ